MRKTTLGETTWMFQTVDQGEASMFANHTVESRVIEGRFTANRKLEVVREIEAEHGLKIERTTKHQKWHSSSIYGGSFSSGCYWTMFDLSKQGEFVKVWSTTSTRR